MRMCFLRALSLAISAVFLGACFSPKFNSDWKKTEDGRGNGQRWVGRWESEKGTGGRLRAIVQAPQGQDLKVFFEAGWHGFTTAYPVQLQAVAKDEGFKVSGNHNLKSFVGGGLYQYDGTLTAEKFSVRYSSSYDRGTFTLAPEKLP